MRNGIAIMGIISFLASLAGCERKKPIYEDTSALENPPPKPPNCAETPALADIRLPDGTLADVRIIQVLETKLYIPTEWMRRGYFVDQLRDAGGYISKMDLGKFLPDNHEIECPGVIHKFNHKHNIPTFGFKLTDRIRERALINFSLKTKIDEVTFTVPYENTMNGKREARLFGTFADTAIIAIPDIVAMFSFPGGRKLEMPQRIAYDDSMKGFVSWLATPPVKRDNDRIFALGVEGQ